MADEHGLVTLIARTIGDWAQPREAVHFGEPTGIALQCAATASPAPGAEVPPDLAAAPLELQVLWKNYRDLRLFEDPAFGQWGLHIFNPHEAAAATRMWSHDIRGDYRRGDIVVGEFLGDGERLLVRSDPGLGDFGSVVVSLPLYSRSEWPVVASALLEFLDRFISMQGAKYWERPA